MVYNNILVYEGLNVLIVFVILSASFPFDV